MSSITNATTFVVSTAAYANTSAVPLATALRWGYKEADASTVRTANSAAVE